MLRIKNCLGKESQLYKEQLKDDKSRFDSPFKDYKMESNKV